jgi:hypothetical protein
MKEQCDFSNAEQGKFYRPEVRLIPPVRLVAERCATVDQLVNEMLKKDLELFRMAKE